MFWNYEKDNNEEELIGSEVRGRGGREGESSICQLAEHFREYCCFGCFYCCLYFQIISLPVNLTMKLNSNIGIANLLFGRYFQIKHTDFYWKEDRVTPTIIAMQQY